MVYTERAEKVAVLSGTSHIELNSAANTPLGSIFKELRRITRDNSESQGITQNHKGSLRITRDQQVVAGRFYIALFSALEQTHFAHT